jgi:hypothetical protein
MSLKIQRLIPASTPRPPKGNPKILSYVFGRDAMDDPAFEGGNVPKAVARFRTLAVEVKMCLIKYDPSEFGRPVYVLCALPDAQKAVAFLQNQLSDSPEDCIQPVYMKEAVNGITEHVGWFDIEDNRFFFVDIRVAENFMALLRMRDVPVLDNNLEYVRTPEETAEEMRVRLQVVADGIGRRMIASVGGETLQAVPRTPAVS